jgi:hypothetical protein
LQQVRVEDISMPRDDESNPGEDDPGQEDAPKDERDRRDNVGREPQHFPGRRQSPSEWKLADDEPGAIAAYEDGYDLEFQDGDDDPDELGPEDIADEVLRGGLEPDDDEASDLGTMRERKQPKPTS